MKHITIKIYMITEIILITHNKFNKSNKKLKYFYKYIKVVRINNPIRL